MRWVFWTVFLVVLPIASWVTAAAITAALVKI
jgi:hypothetical protein